MEAGWREQWLWYTSTDSIADALNSKECPDQPDTVLLKNTWLGVFYQAPVLSKFIACLSESSFVTDFRVYTFHVICKITCQEWAIFSGHSIDFDVYQRKFTSFLVCFSFAQGLRTGLAVGGQLGRGGQADIFENMIQYVEIPWTCIHGILFYVILFERI